MEAARDSAAASTKVHFGSVVSLNHLTATHPCPGRVGWDVRLPAVSEIFFFVVGLQRRKENHEQCAVSCSSDFSSRFLIAHRVPQLAINFCGLPVTYCTLTGCPSGVLEATMTTHLRFSACGALAAQERTVQARALPTSDALAHPRGWHAVGAPT
jgi:hypothetical protein